MGDIELRFNLLDRAKDLLLKNWEQKIKVEEAVARFENRPPKGINPPTLFKIMSTADKLYKFVHKAEEPVEESEGEETSGSGEAPTPSTEQEEDSESEASE